jgi:hypothetical protein
MCTLKYKFEFGKIGQLSTFSTILSFLATYLFFVCMHFSFYTNDIFRERELWINEEPTLLFHCLY